MESQSVSTLAVPLERDVFLRSLVRELSGVLEDVVGLEQASGFISVVGQNIGEWINNEYKQQLNTKQLTVEQVIDVLIDLKARINGDFYLISKSENQAVFGCRTCPFEEKVTDRNSLCMMTSNVFGVITSQNLGYAKVILEETIARRNLGCRVTVYFKSTPASEEQEGNEYYRSE